MFQKGDLVKLNFPPNSWWKRWNGLDRGDLGVVLEEWGDSCVVYFPASREEKIQAIHGSCLKKVEKVDAQLD